MTAASFTAACFGRLAVLTADGFTLKLLLAGGGYTYPSGGLHTDVDGTLVSASALPGWRVTSDGISIAVYAGPIVQDYWLSPYDPGSLLHGFYSGAQLAADVWYQPTPTSMVAINGTIASIAAIGTLRAAVGWQFPAVLRRPRGTGIVVHRLSAMAGRRAHHRLSYRWCSIGQRQPGGRSNLSAASGPYLRLGVNTRF